MKTLKFKCTTLSDVILNAKSANSGPNETLDFIPGNNFLGIVASRLYPQVSPNEALAIFHTGKVRFGDAHPSYGNFRGLKVPAAMFYPKLSSPTEELYLHHLITDKDMGSKQLKQCRNGFYDFSSQSARLIKTSTNFSIKSAYDRHSRRSKDEQLFGYQSLQKGVEMYFSVEIDSDSSNDSERLAEKISSALIGIKRIGKSRTAQYGLINIEPSDFKEVDSGEPVTQSDRQLVTVYADSRLIFLDEYGMPTFTPSAEQLNLKGEILWNLSQVRTFSYAPWNFKRQSFDTDRCGIEKGSVLVVRLDGHLSAVENPLQSKYVGAYNNEGFGRVIYNPPFLKGDMEGKATVTLNLSSVKSVPQITERNISKSETPLLAYLRHRKTENVGIYEMVNNWVGRNYMLFRGDNFSSQWGTIRSIAMSASDLASLKRTLFADPTGYLTHGVAKEKWAEKGRLTRLKDFIDELHPTVFRHVIVNLAAEMAKKCK